MIGTKAGTLDHGERAPSGGSAWTLAGAAVTGVFNGCGRAQPSGSTTTGAAVTGVLDDCK